RGIFWPRLDAQGKALVGVKPIREAYEAQGGTFVELDAPRQILPGVWLTGPVPRTYPERNWSGKGRLETPRGVEEDTIPEDQSLVLDTDRGLVVVLGCGHAGVINTLTYARRVVREAPIYAVIGGLHLYEKDDETLDWTATKLRELELMHLLGAHCTGLEAVYRIREKAGLSRRTCLVGAVGASFTLEKGIDPLDLAR
ncbi:MAG TPA: MBL fold metallo-hydrolase, partial [Vicinamibacteria bacterium]|nr:MBL fold metallo-hydrolase [Vicinamibacteria bacterium]